MFIFSVAVVKAGSILKLQLSSYGSDSIRVSLHGYHGQNK